MEKGVVYVTVGLLGVDLSAKTCCAEVWWPWPRWFVSVALTQEGERRDTSAMTPWGRKDF